MKTCFMGDNKPATVDFNIPCAPGGKLSVCQDCANDPDILQKVFEKYKAGHSKRIQVFKTPGNPSN